MQGDEAPHTIAYHLLSLYIKLSQHDMLYCFRYSGLKKYPRPLFSVLQKIFTHIFLISIVIVNTYAVAYFEN